MKPSNPSSLLTAYRREIRFFLLFSLFFFLFQAAHYMVRPYIAPFVVNTLTAGGSSKLINILMPAEKTVSQNEYISSGNFKLQIARGCEGIEGIIILIAAILAFPAGIRSKISGLMGGVLILYGLNLLRIAGLYYTLKYKPVWFDLMHIYVGQTVIIFMAVIYFIAWLNLQTETNGKNS